ncbi:MAG: T9SS type A sorting domain-containing protein [Bacteroidetes bacterium]|nr:T9SS type A sorting domain-containing protein [Bacteroidota bacterium]
MFLEHQGVQTIQDNQLVQIPVRVTETIDLAAASLVMNFPQNDLDIVSVEAAYDNQTLAFNTVGNQLRIGWYTLQPKTLFRNDVLMTLTVRLKNSGSSSSLGFELTPESSIADYYGINFVDKSLAIPALVNSKQGFVLSQNIPNPFKSSTQITYTLPEDGFIKLELLDIVGKQISVLTEGVESAGIHNYTLSANTLSDGVYFYRMSVNTGSQQYSQTKRMVISQ